MTLTLEQQVSSLKSSQRLKELGINQKNGLFYWEKSPYSNEYSIFMRYTGDSYMQDWCCAFTCSEIGEILPNKNVQQWYSEQVSCIATWVCRLVKIDEFNKGIYGNKTVATTEVEARALMLIHLIENGLIKIKGE